MPGPRSRSPRRRSNVLRRSAPRSARGRSPLTRCRPSAEVKALRSLLEHHDALAKENGALREQLQRKSESSERAEALKRDISAKEDESAALKRELAAANEKIDGLSRQLADTITDHQMAEEQLRLRIRLLLQQFGQHVEQSIIQQQQSAQPPQSPAPAPELAPTLPVEAEPSAPGAQLPCDAPTDEYTSSSSSSSEDDDEPPGPPVPPAAEL